MQIHPSEATYTTRILVVFAHPALERSRINRALIDAISDLEGVTIRDLYEEYPDFYIDVAREQSLLIEHDLIVLQHPLYWYSAPALLKQWIDLVFTHGWAYGSNGNALRGKALLQVVSTGGPASSYSEDGHHRASLDDFLLPFKRTATLCGMSYLQPVAVHGAHGLDPAQVVTYSQGYRGRLSELRDLSIEHMTSEVYKLESREAFDP